MSIESGELQLPKDNLLRTCFVVGAFELVRSLYFSFSSVSLMVLHTNWYTIMAFLSTIAWIVTVGVLFVALLTGRPTLLVFWLLFTAFATATDIVYLIWNVTSSPIFDAEHFKRWTISYLGIFYEVTCLYLVFRYFKRLYSYVLLEGDNYDTTTKVRSTEDYIDDETQTQSPSSKYRTSGKSSKG
ncbi:uncharacterized protein LOC27207551 [Drosophila simulans]|uniref:MARVEL domain-containing protein n=1 Tax=Drosophila simulans TaxID=7240 RepID=A0A0J9RSX0_DROSI|nr:uncharacterized protein LOC27207551 [Drosophila simulans]KMY98853.1 uncharacterized protein Dsimw501_GD27702 [Drosophila simulans]